VLAVPIQSVTVRTMDQLQQKKAEQGQGEAIAGETQAPAYVPDKDGFVEVVFVVKEGVVHAKQVRTGIQSDTHIEILDGLAQDEEVVVGSFRAISKDLQNGTQVKAPNNKAKKDDRT